jgi:hypothetical protein
MFKQLAICFSGRHFYSLIDLSLMPCGFTAAPIACCAARYHDRHRA